MSPRRAVVVGGGVAGLAAATALRRGAPGTEVVVVEGADRLGGKLRVSRFVGQAVDEGAESLLARAPEGVALAAAAGLAGQIRPVATSSASVAVGGAPHPLPAGTVMGIPTDPSTLGQVLSPATVARVAAEPAGQWPVLAGGEDVAVGALVGDRLGREVVDRLVDPLLGGVYAGSADLLSLRATVPPLASALAEHGSLVAAARAANAAARGGEGPVFVTLRDGLGTLPSAVAAAAGLDVRLGLPVRQVRRTAEGFRLVAGPVPDPTYLDADAVVVAVPAPKAAPVLEEVAPWAAAELRGIEYASMAIVTLAYRDLPLPPGSGLLVPTAEGLAVKALTFCSQKWAHLSGGPVLVRASVGRHRSERVLHRDDADLVRLVAAEVGTLVGGGHRPVAARVSRWGGALPQYAVGHLERVRRIREAVARVRGLAVCGAAYEGVGIPACVRTGEQAAAQVLPVLTGGED